MPDPNYGYDARYDLPGKLGQYIRGARAVKDFVQEHPAATAAIPAAALFPPSLLGLLGAAGVGVGATAIDKAHPLTAQPSDWEARTREDNLEDMLSSGMYAAAGSTVAPAARLVGRALPTRAVARTARLVDESPINSRLAALREEAFGDAPIRGFRYPERAPMIESATDATSSFAPVGPFIVPRDIPVTGPAPSYSIDPFLRPLNSAAANPVSARVRMYRESTPIERAIPGILPDRIPASQIRPTGELREVPEMFVARGPANFVKRPVASPDGSFHMQKWDWKAPTSRQGIPYPPDATHSVFLR